LLDMYNKIIKSLFKRCHTIDKQNLVLKNLQSCVLNTFGVDLKMLLLGLQA